MGEYTSLTLAQLRDKAKLTAQPNDYSLRSWLSNASRTAAQAQLDDAHGERERAFVGYLKACQFFQAFLEHREYARVKKEGERWADWGTYSAFLGRRGEYLSRARELEGELRGREVERGMSEVALSPAPTATTTATTKGEEPDTSTGGSIAARLAALKGAGMQVGVTTKRSSRDMSSPHMSSPHTAIPTTTSQQTFPTNGTTAPASRRGSVASVNGLAMTPAPGPGTPRFEKENGGMEGNKTGSSLNSIKSFERYQAQNQNQSSLHSQPRSQSESQSQSQPQPQSSIQAQQGNASPRTPALPIPPSPTTSSIRTLPTPPNSAPGSGGRGSRSGSGSGFGLGIGNPSGNANGNGNGKPEVIQEDEEMAYFSTAFPSLAELEEQVGGTEGNGVGARSEGSVNGNGVRPTGAPMPSTPREGSSFSNSLVDIQPPIDTQRTKPPLPPTPNVKPKALSTAPAPGPAAPKPSLPFTNAIMPETLYGYLNDPALRLLVVDTRSGEDHQRGWIGGAGEVGEGRSGDFVWVDPTILSRPGMDSIKLENALSILPPAEHKAFLNRNLVDLVVLYDTASTSFPKPGAEPTAPGRLFSIIFENEFRKALPRSPVLLVGGYQAWREEVERRRRAEGAGYVAVGKGPPPVISAQKPSVVPESPETRALRRDTGVYRSSAYSRNITDNFNPPYPQSMVGLGQSYNGQPLIPHSSASATYRSQPSAYSSSPYASAAPTPPPLASTSPGPLSRKRSDYVDQHNKPYSGYQGHAARASMDYPQIHHPSIPQPPPAAATSSSERQESRPRADRSASIISFDGLSRLPESDDMMYWNDAALGISGLKNLGNTCYMNSTLQCLSATYPLARFFRDGSFKRAINTVNPMGTKGDLAKAFATLISVLWNEQYTFLSPVTFRKSISTYAPTFAGTDQHDSQEFLSFLLDGLHEDLNRIRAKPPPVEMTPEREAALETLPPSVAAEKEWQIYKQRNDSLIVDLFQGQYRNRMECMTCHKTSTTYDAFMYLSLPVPQGKQKVVLQELIDNFVQTEVMEKDDAWNCPRCKVPRKATKSLSIARLPPVLLIHLKRFTTTNGVFWDKSETPVIFPIKHLDLTRYIPPSPAQLEGKNPSGPASPTSTTGPFLYDLFSITNHMGSLSNGHYTAFVNSSKGWKYCDDSKITPASDRDVVNKPAHAYILWYKRTLPPRTVPATAA